MKGKNSHLPLRINIDVTRKCNLNCWYCHSSSGPSYSGPEISERNIRDIFEAAEKNKVFDITITGGEPTLWKGLKAVSKYSQKLSFASLQMITNAINISPETIALLKSTKLNRLCVSLDGTEEINDATRGAGSFKKIINNIRKLRKIVNDLTVISVICKNNYKKWPELTKILLDLGINQHHLTPVCFSRKVISQGLKNNMLKKQHFQKIRRLLEKTRIGLPSDFYLYFNDILVYGPESRIIPLNLLTEYLKGYHLVIRPDGQTRTSIRAWGRSWRQHEVLGNINDRSLNEIIKIYRKKLDLWLETEYNLEEELRRKFHLPRATPKEISLDISQVERNPKIRINLTHQKTKREEKIHNLLKCRWEPRLFLRKQESLKNIRVKAQGDIFYVFNNSSFRIAILDKKEYQQFLSLYSNQHEYSNNGRPWFSGN